MPSRPTVHKTSRPAVPKTKRRLAFIIFVPTTLALLLYGALFMLGVNPKSLSSLPSMMTSIGAKLACSGYFVTGLSQQQVEEDIASYSPALKLIDIHIDDANQRVTSTLFDDAENRAIYQKSTGCTLDRGQPLNNIDNYSPPSKEALWPRGEQVNTTDPAFQHFLQTLLDQDQRQGLDTRALLVVKNGNIIGEAYQSPFTEETAFLGWSMGKSLTAIIMANLEMNGYVDWDEDNLFDEWKNDARNDIQLKHLMTMTSGLKFDESYQAGTDATNMLFEDISAATRPIAQTLAHTPGTHWAYSSGTTNLLMHLIGNRLGGAPATYQYLYKNIYQPLGIQGMVFEPDPNGIPIGSSYIFGSARDWARIGQLMLNEGTINDRIIVSENWVELAQVQGSADNYNSYGHQFWLNSGKKTRWPSLPKDSYAAMGNRKQMVMIIPSENLTIVRLGWTSGSYPFDQRIRQIIDAAKTNTDH